MNKPIELIMLVSLIFAWGFVVVAAISAWGKERRHQRGTLSVFSGRRDPVHPVLHIREPM